MKTKERCLQFVENIQDTTERLMVGSQFNRLPVDQVDAQLKNIIKMDAMTNDQVSLLAYNNTEFYKPKDIYLNQLNIFDSRDIYNNVNLSSYTNNDTIAIKANKLYEIKLKKQKLLMELKELKNG